MSARQAILWHLDRSLAVVEPAGTLDAVADALRALAARLRPRWAAESDAMFVWPVFKLT